MSNKYGKADAERLLSEINGWIMSCDNKASILLAFLAIFVGLTTDVFNIFETIGDKFSDSGVAVFAGVLLLVLIILYFVCILGSVGFLSNVLFARTKTMIKFKKKNNLNFASPLYFGAIAKMSKEKFSELTAELTEEELIKELNEQCIIASKISELKFKAFNLALIFSVSLAVITIIILAIM